MDKMLVHKAETVYQLLVQAYGMPERQDAPGFEALIQTLLSANTTDVNSGKAYHRLMERFDGEWDRVRTAPLEEIKEAIRVAGMYNQKAPHIQQTLQRLHEERGVYDIEHVREMAVEEGLTYLSSFPGVGHKTASIVLLFCFGKGAFPVDTHVQRITQRLGLSSPTASPVKIKQLWEALLPPEFYYPLHIHLIRHGRQICHARSPRCGACGLQEQCRTFLAQAG